MERQRHLRDRGDGEGAAARSREDAAVSAVAAGAGGQLSAAFLRDITENIAPAARDAPIHGFVAYAPAGTRELVRRPPRRGHRLRAGRRLAADAARCAGLRPLPAACGAGDACARAIGAVCLVNSDSPTLPTAFLVEAARALLAPGDRMVLGPADDGGYYLLGMQQPHAHLFADIAWSTSEVAAQRVRAQRARARSGRAADLVRRRRCGIAGAACARNLTAPVAGLQPYAAPATRAWLRTSRLRRTASPIAAAMTASARAAADGDRRARWWLLVAAGLAVLTAPWLPLQSRYARCRCS